MSEFFVKKFNKSNKCAGCKASKLKIGSRVYSLCVDHLAKARDHWRNWAHERRNHGLCIRCDRKAWDGGSRLNRRGYHVPGGKRLLRCRLHTQENRENCMRWTQEQLKANPNHFTDKWNEVKAKFLANGRCICAGHPPLPAGFNRCDKCRKRRSRRAR
jgi:hypothetical protein